MKTSGWCRYFHAMLCWCAGVFLFAGTLSVAAQDVESDLTIDRVTYEVVNGRPVVMVTLTNRDGGRMGYTGRVEVIHPGGTLAEAQQLASGSVPADTSIRVPVYLSSGLLDGDYTVRVYLLTGNGEPLAESGPHNIRIGEPPSSGPNLPAIAMLIAGLLLILASFRVGHTRRRRRNVPEVATIRKVAVSSAPAKEAGKITPLIPPRYRHKE